MMFGWIIGLILIVVLIAALNKGNLFNGNNAKPEKLNSGKTAMEILKNRYAKGEIDHSEYEEKKAELEKSN